MTLQRKLAVVDAEHHDDTRWLDHDWQAQLRGAVTSLAQLAERLQLSDEEVAGCQRALSAGLPLRITPLLPVAVRSSGPRLPHSQAGGAAAGRGGASPGGSAGPARRSPARSRALLNTTLSRPGAAAGDRPMRHLLPLLHPLAVSGRRPRPRPVVSPRRSLSLPRRQATDPRRHHQRRRSGSPYPPRACYALSHGCDPSNTSTSSASPPGYQCASRSAFKRNC